MPLSLGQRVQVKDHSGIIRYVGKTEFAPGVWVGIELDQEVGRNDGSVDGVRYFNLSKDGMYGVFVREKMVNGIETGQNINIQQDDMPALHEIIQKLQSKLKSATTDIKEYKENIRKLEKILNQTSSSKLSLESQLEQVSVDNEYLADNNKILQKSLENIQIKYEELKADFQLLQEEFALNKQIEEEVRASLKVGDYTEENVKVILERNRQLENALVSLKSLTDQNEINLKSEINTLKNSKESSDNEETYSVILGKLNAAENKITRLQEQLDSALESEKIIDSLNSKNEELVQKVEQLTNTVEELTELHELDKNLEENQILVERDLNKNIKSLKDIIQNDKVVIKDLEKTNKFLELKLSEIKSSTKDLTTTENNEILKSRIKTLTLDLKNSDMSNLGHIIRLRVTERQLFFALNTPETINETLYKPIFNIIYNFKKALVTTNAIIDCLILLKDYSIYPSTVFYTMIYNLNHLKIAINFFISLWEYNYESESFVNSINFTTSALTDVNENLESIVNRFKDNIYDKIDIQFIDSFIDNIYSTLNIKRFFVESPTELNYNRFYLKYLLEIALIKEETYKNVLNNINNSILQFLDGKDLLKKYETYLKGILQKLMLDIDRKLRERLNEVENEVRVEYRISSSPSKLDFSNVGINEVLSIFEIYDDIESGITINEEFEERAIQRLHKLESNLAEYRKLLELEFIKEKSSKIIIYDKTTTSELHKQDLEKSLLDMDALKVDYENLKLKSIEKDILINELKINVGLLEKNLALEHHKNKNYLDAIKKELKSINDEKKSLEVRYSSLLDDNSSLKLEIHNLIKSSQIFESGHLRKYNDILSEKSYNVNLSLIEEILFLKKVIKVNSQKISSSEELDWLKEPLVPGSNNLFDYKSSNFHKLSTNLKELSNRAAAFNSVIEKQEWRSKMTSHKHRLASLEEGISRYKTIKDAVIPSSLS